MTYEQVLEKIHSFSVYGSRLGLERMEQLLELLGNPHEKLQVIHVAGTNGKGSVCRYVYSVLTEAGYRTGAYFSPYVERFTERIECGGEEISPDRLVRYSEKVFAAVDEMISRGHESPTEFEVVTAIGMLFFEDAGADYVILEVGLGGRGDSTNVCSRPCVTAITSIDFDHMAVLGNTLPEIAAEKAGIIKAGVPVVSLVRDAGARRVIEERAAALNAPHYDANGAEVKDVVKDISGYGFSVSFNTNGLSAELKELKLGMAGMHQISNGICALYILEILKSQGAEISDNAVRTGLEKAFQPVRFELFSAPGMTPFILDGAHNRAGVESLARTAGEMFEGKRILLCTGILGDKEYGEMARMLAGIADDIIVTRVPVPRGMSSEELGEAFRTAGGSVRAVYEDYEEAFRASADAADEYDAVIWAGSIYLVGAIRTLIREYISCLKKM